MNRKTKLVAKAANSVSLSDFGLTIVKFAWLFCVHNDYIQAVLKQLFVTMKFVKSNENAAYACINYGEAFCPEAIEDRSICIDGDIGNVVELLKG